MAPPAPAMLVALGVLCLSLSPEAEPGRRMALVFAGIGIIALGAVAALRRRER